MILFDYKCNILLFHVWAIKIRRYINVVISISKQGLLPKDNTD